MGTFADDTEVMAVRNNHKEAVEKPVLIKLIKLSPGLQDGV